MDVNGGVSPYSFNWTNLSGNFIDSIQDLDSLLPGTYYLNVLDFNNCNAKDTVTLIPGIEIKVNAGFDTLVCIGDSLNLVGSSSGTMSPVVSWNLPGGSISTDSVTNYLFDDTTQSVYDFVYIVSDQACTVKDSIKVSVAALPIVDAGADAVIGLGTTFNLGGAPTAPPGSSYIWSPLTDFSNSGDATFENPEITMLNSETYTVIVIDSNGCISSDQIFVDLIPDIVVPSGFSPNGDGINDTWIIANISQFSSNSIRVYNRWGSLIYDKDKAGQDWSGNGANNKPIPVGTYYYVIEWTDYDGKKASLNGPVTIIR
jgi:gliding motility-associated-like protein